MGPFKFALRREGLSSLRPRICSPLARVGTKVAWIRRPIRYIRHVVATILD